ncbi:MAG: hypothetical protein Q7R89_00205 [bacterium]|nr:hypothetical protein [bacterium]
MGCDYGSFNPGTCPKAFRSKRKNKKERMNIEKSYSVTDFSICDKVVWNMEIYPSMVGDMIKRYSNGPFRVVGLYLMMASRDHPLMVTVETPVGRQGFAGQWFKKEI